MDINTWLTVITVFFAILAFFPKEERKLLEYKIGKLESLMLLILLVVVIPYLILFPKLIHRLPFLKVFTIQNGIQPSDIAFAIFYITFFWILLRLFLFRPKNRVTKTAVDLYIKLLIELPFNQFYSLFIKYTPDNISQKDWTLYESLFTHPEFLKGIVQHQPSYLFKNWEKYNNETDFRNIFSLFLKNTQSPYYTEIKAHKNSSEILANSPFLQTVLVKNLKQSIDNKILPLLYDTIQAHLRAEKNKQDNSLYNQSYNHKFLNEDEGYEFPVYYHIKFIGLLYSNAIINRVDIGDLSHFQGHMRTLYSETIASMINNLVVKTNNEKEYPTNYHWLIDEIFNIISNWLEIFGGEHPVYPEKYENGVLKFGHIYFDSKSSYLYFIPQCFSNCFSELHKELKAEKITKRFINMRFHYDIISYYYKWYAKAEIKSLIETEILEHIPPDILASVLDYSLDEQYATRYNSFKVAKFHGVNQEEINIQRRLWNFLNSRNLLA